MREKMLACFRAFGRGKPVTVRVRHNGQVFRCSPAINGTGDLYVSLFKGKSTRRYLAVSLEEWTAWAEEFCTETV